MLQLLPVIQLNLQNFLIIGFSLKAVALVWWIIHVQRKKRLLELQNRQMLQNHTALSDLVQEKRHFISLLAHELRSPLALARLNTFHLLSQEGLPEEDKKDLEEIAGVSAVMEEIIHKILQIENLDEPLPTHHEMQMDAVIKESIARYTGLAREKKVQIEWNVDKSTDFKIFANPYLLMQVSNNLLSNAIKFSKNGQKIFVSLKRRHDAFEIKVKDQGIGIEQADQALIFQKHYRKNHMDLGGLGIGLYLVKWFVDRLKGQINVKSAPGEGAEFIVILPSNSR